MRSACVAGAYLVGVAILFTLQIGRAIAVPVVLAVSAPPLVYGALSMVLLREAPFVRRLSWIGGACLTHVVLGVLAALELMVAGGLSPGSAAAQVFALFAPAPALTLLATPLVILPFAARATTASAAPRGEAAAPLRAEAPRQPRLTAPPQTPFARAPRRLRAAPEPLATPGPMAAPLASSAPASTAVPAAAPAPAPSPTQPPASPRGAAPAAASVAAAAVAPDRRSGVDGKPAARHEVMVRIPFARIAPQLPADAFVLPLDRLGESLKEPHVLLVPQRVVLAQMGAGGIAIDWATVAPQFPELALGMSEAEFRNRYRDLTLSLPVDEVLAQLPPDTVPLVSAVVNAEAPAVPPPMPPPLNGRSTLPYTAPASFAPTPARKVDLAPVSPSESRTPVPRPSAATVLPPAPPTATRAPVAERPMEAVDRETLARIVACFNGVGTFQAAGERAAGTSLVSLVVPSLPREAVATCAARLVRFLGDGAGEVATVRTARAVLVLVAAPTPIVVAARRPGAPVALLELRALRASADGGKGVVTAPPPPSRTLRAVSVDPRVARAGHALRSFGDVEPAVFDADGALVYVFSAPGRDATPLGTLALSVSDALREGGDLGALVSVVFRRGRERTLVRPVGTGAVLAATGPVTRPGCAHRDADRTATVLAAL
jgi:hypothetical protein